jgi:hypothetical protein
LPGPLTFRTKHAAVHDEHRFGVRTSFLDLGSLDRTDYTLHKNM